MAERDDMERAADQWATRNSYSQTRFDLAREAYMAGYQHCESELSPEPAVDDPT